MIKILFVSRIDAFNVESIISFLKNNFKVSVIIDKRESSIPKSIYDWEGDYILCYLCPWIIPDRVIQKATKAAINFHPGSPSYPGFGCYNFALYHEVDEYGVTCHHLAHKVDTGRIISVKMFPLLKSDKVSNLIQRTYVYLNFLFFEISLGLLKNNSLPKSNLEWQRKPFTRKQLNDLCKLSKNMNEKEINNRKKATTFPGKPGPYFID